MLRTLGSSIRAGYKSLSLVRCFAEESKPTPSTKYPKEKYFGDNTGWIIPISPNHNVCVRIWQNRVLIDIRKFFKDPNSDKMLPTQKGLSLNEQQWRALVDSIKQVDECLADMNERVKDLPPVPNTGNSNGYYNNKRTYNRNTYSRSNNPENNIPF